MFAIVPAYNEEKTVAEVVMTLRQSDVFADVYVVDDGSKDDTSEVAKSAGAKVIRPAKNLGKGGAMRFAYKQIPNDNEPVAFVDADLKGLRPDHLQRLATASRAGFDMVCGVRDYGLFGNLVQPFSPLITGERVLARWVLDALPETCWDGYRIETGMNVIVKKHGGRTAVLIMDGVEIVNKVRKVGLLQGTKANLKMLWQIRRTRQAMEKSEGRACKL